MRAVRRGLHRSALSDALSRPAAAFSSAQVPPSPDYAQSECWAARGNDYVHLEVVPSGCAPSPPPAARHADVFYVHPTSHFAPSWNAAWDDEVARRQVDELSVGMHTAAFSSACRVFAPRYRQMTYSCFLTEDTSSARAAGEVAYSDVAAAFERFLEHHSRGRPFVLASHSQGTLHATRLLQARIDKDAAVARRCVAAYLIGMYVPVSLVNGLAHFAASDDAEQPHAVVSWNLRASPSATDGPHYLHPDVGPGLWMPTGEYHPCDEPSLQTSPLTWRCRNGTTAAGPKSEAEARPEAGGHLGVGLPTYEPGFAPSAVFEGSFSSKLTGIKRARRALTAEPTAREVVVGGALSPKLAASDLGQGVGDLHTLDLSLFFFNLRRNVEARVRAFAEARPPRPRPSCSL